MSKYPNTDGMESVEAWDEYDWEMLLDPPPEGTVIRHGFADSPEGWASRDACFVMETPDGHWIVAAGWCDTTGWDCRSDSEVKEFTTYDDAVRWGLTDEQRRELGIAQPDEGVRQ